MRRYIYNFGKRSGLNTISKDDDQFVSVTDTNAPIICIVYNNGKLMVGNSDGIFIAKNVDDFVINVFTNIDTGDNRLVISKFEETTDHCAEASEHHVFKNGNISSVDMKVAKNRVPKYVEIDI